MANFPVAYCGLKIITSLSLRFPDFQRVSIDHWKFHVANGAYRLY
ncbi:Serine/threonine protein kinase [methanotrophic endosymbiont of Bathymodiolus azoricus (Menez Gwen)]|nr:Serine/threonine protein kinase [methanotrophic endosymbiont of Bathymodiolus azoricus (Menez Gwen)]